MASEIALQQAITEHCCMHLIEDISLIDSKAQWGLYGCTVIAGVLAFAITLWRRRFRATAVVVLGSAVVTLVSKYLIEQVWRPFPEAVHWQIYACVGVAAAVLALSFLTPKRGGMSLLVIVGIIGAVGSINLAYQMYPTPAAFEKNKYSQEMSKSAFDQARKDGRLPAEKGVELTLPLPASSAFTPRDAKVYLPPAYWRSEQKLPVIVLMAGNPGSPSDWFQSALADRTADDYQRHHGGVAPIIASVDATGGYAANPVCADSGNNDVMSYIAKDVPKELKQQFRVDENAKDWTVGGLSYGGTCSLQVVTNFPNSYGSFLDFSGQQEPTTGNHDETVTKYFSGSEAEFKAHNPADLLVQHQHDAVYRGIAGKFVAGTNDHDATKALEHLNQLAQAAGISTAYFSVDGGHDFSTWRHAFEQTIDWVAQRGGIG